MADNTVGRRGARPRVYFCQPCNARHAQPTGDNCTRNTDTESQTRSSPPRTDKPEPKKRGRKPRVKPVSEPAIQGKPSASTSSSEAQPHGSDLQLVLAQLQSMHEEVAVAREADRRETKKAIDALTERLEAPILSSDDDVDETPRDVGVGSAKQQTKSTGIGATGEKVIPQPFARPAVKGDLSGGAAITPEMVQNALDPIARLRGDRISSAQAQLIMSAVVGQESEAEGSNSESGYYRTLNDIKNTTYRGQMIQFTDRMVKKPYMTVYLFQTS